MRSQRFAPEFKDEAVRQVLERGGSWTGTDLHRRLYFFGGWQNRAVGRVDVILGGVDVVCDEGGDTTDESKVCGEGVLNPVD